jgi:hypothetical protein
MGRTKTVRAMNEIKEMSAWEVAAVARTALIPPGMVAR